VKSPHISGGFTYIGLLLAVALLGTALAAVGTFWSTESKRDAEIELLFVGEQFRLAIVAYYENVPVGQQRRFPQKFEDLLIDKRWPSTKRHLRKIYVDPMTGSRDWGLTRLPGDKGIIGVHSLSPATPLKRHGFPPSYEQFATAKTYRDWQFAYSVPATDKKDSKPSSPFQTLPSTSPSSPSNQ